MSIRWGSILTPETLTRIESALGRDLDKLAHEIPDDDAPIEQEDEVKEAE